MSSPQTDPTHPASDDDPDIPGCEVLGFIGQGGMGSVYKVRQQSLNRVVAVKLLSVPAQEGGLDFAARFRVEAQAMARLTHPNIVSVHDFGITRDGRFFYVMELVEGTDLSQKILNAGRLPPPETLRILLAVCAALECAHAQGVIHRDIKPSNILISHTGVVKVADFGLAKVDDPSTASLTISGTTMGSHGYAAPEIYSNASSADHRADVYSLAVLLYQMLTGDLPRGMFKLPSEKVPGLDPRLDEIICKALEEDREDRYPGISEMRAELEEVFTSFTARTLAIAPVETIPPSALAQHEPGMVVRLSWKRVTLAVAAMVILAGGLWYNYIHGEARTGLAEAANEKAWQNLLSPLDLKKQSVSGHWATENGVLTNRDDTGIAAIEFPVESPMNYDLRVKLTPQRNTGGYLIFALQHGSHAGAMVIDDSHGPAAGLESIGGKRRLELVETVRRLTPFLPMGSTYELLFHVRNEGLLVLVNGEPLYRWKGDWSETALEGTWLPPNHGGRPFIGLGCFDSKILVHSVEYLSVAGAAAQSLPSLSFDPVKAAASTLPPSTPRLFHGHRYQYIPGSFTWAEAEANAASLGGHLVTLTDAEENHWVWEQFSPYLSSQGKRPLYERGWWIGGKPQDTEGTWQWITGEPFEYTCWSVVKAPAARTPRLRQHNNGGGGSLSAWTPVHYSGPCGYVVEWDDDGRPPSSEQDPEQANHPLEMSELQAIEPHKPPTGATDAEQRELAAWLFNQPRSTEPTHSGPNQVPDLLVAGLGRNLRRQQDLPQAPLSITRVRMGPTRMDEASRKQFGVLSRLSSLYDLRIYGAESAEILSCLHQKTGLGTVVCKGSPNLPAMSDQDLLHLARLTRLHTLRLEGWRGLTGVGLAHIKAKRSVDSLSLLECPDLNDEGLGEIARFTSLKTLALSAGVVVTDAGLAKLAKLTNLEHLTLSFLPGCKATAAGLTGLTKLRSLHLEGLFPGAGFQFVGQISSLEELQCLHNPSVNDESLAALAGLGKMRVLRLDNTRITGTGFAHYRDFNNKLALRIDDCFISDDGLRSIAAHIPQLERITLSRNKPTYSLKVMAEELAKLKALTHFHASYNFKDPDLIEIAKLDGLQSLSLQFSSVTDTGIAYLKPLVHLTELSLPALPLTDTSIPTLIGLSDLARLDISGTKISDLGLTTLKQHLPKCEIKR